MTEDAKIKYRQTSTRYCSNCSMCATDIRTFLIDGDVLTCTHCNTRHRLVPIAPESPYRFLKRL